MNLDHGEAKALVLLDVDRGLPASFSMHEAADRAVTKGLLVVVGRSWALTPAGRVALPSARKVIGL